MYLATLYKARKVPTKQPVCVICLDRTRGTTQRLRLGYGVEIWLCEGHAATGSCAGEAATTSWSRCGASGRRAGR
jgi:hypothetical protein